jgi:hypothetical protein
MSELVSVKRLLKRKGWVVQISTKTRSGGTDDRPTYSTAEVDAQAFLGSFTAHETDGTLVQANDKKAYIVGTATLDKQSNIIDNGITYHIESLRTVSASNDPFLYIAQLRA